MNNLIALMLLGMLAQISAPAVLAEDPSADADAPERKTLVWPDGTRYVGGVLDGKRTGKGTIFWQDGTRFVGQFKNDMRNGPGTMILPDGTVYTGFFRDDELVDTEETLAASRAAEPPLLDEATTAALNETSASAPAEADALSSLPQVDDQDLLASAPASSEAETRPASEPVPEPSPEPEPEDPRVLEITQAVKDNLEQTIDTWAGAWADQNVERYLSFYSDDFRVPGNQSRRTWEGLRRTRLTGPEFIEVSIAYERFQLVRPDVVDVMFRQTYRSNSYRDVTAKTLRLQRETDRWRIITERSR